MCGAAFRRTPKIAGCMDHNPHSSLSGPKLQKFRNLQLYGKFQKMFLLIFTVLILYVVYSWLKIRPANFPPGPPTVPILGALPFMPKENVHYAMEKWRKQYGGVVGLVLGTKLSCAVVETKVAKEVLKRDEFQARPISKFITERSFDRRIGIIFADGEEWQEQRRFAVHQLKDFGLGKSSMEGIIMEEVTELLEEIKDKTLQVSGLFNISTVNVLWGIIAGTRYKHSDPKLQKLMQLLTAFFRSGNPTGGNLRMIFPFLKYIFPNYMNEIQIASEQLNNFFLEIINEHAQSLDENNPRDFIDVYLIEMNSKKGSNTTFDVQTLQVVCSDLFSAGSESVGNTLGFALLYMVLYPEVQEKVHATIDENIGRNHKLSLQDKVHVPYVEAVILEVMRCNTIAPITVPHRAMKDTTLNGYFIPKNTTVLVSLWNVLQDKEHWGDPCNFRPSRFIDENGKLVKDNTFIPFGLGKRLCPGEALARNNLFLFFTSIMQKYSVHLPPGHPTPSTLSLPGFTTAPKPFEVTFKSR
ncbi:Methyl farnesoate epoxidase [Gryllus bimaculatus]|nr:Methyl farnesoate epoxidase [Gryllus bimaculatus]